MHGEIDNPMTDTRLDPKPRADADPWLEVECVVKVKFRMKVMRDPTIQSGVYLTPDCYGFGDSISDTSHDAIIAKATVLLLEGRDRNISVEYSE